ncbi:MAG: DMT family transporter [Muribaculaceae bacterium]|nr:DMT family transporter [Muribaculaceae bacterium]
MWIALALVSALCLGFYDIFKKLSVRANDVLMVLMLNTVFGALYMSPFLIAGMAESNFGFGNTLIGHMQILLKSLIVLGSWLLGYFAIKHLPLTVQGPINASRPVIVLVGALLIFGERLNWVQWIGIILGFASLFFISRIGAKEGFSLKHSKWIWMSIGATALGAVSALYDKYLLRSYSPIEVQGWYSLYQCIIMVAVISIMRSLRKKTATVSGVGEGKLDTKFEWRWTIPCIALFLTVADMAYFYSLSIPGSMVAIVSMIRRGSVIVSFVYGVVALHEKNIKPKLIDLGVLLVSLALLVIGSQMN